jgi:hypothetical protein
MGRRLVIDRTAHLPVRPKDFESVTARMRSGSGGSRTTATSDSGDFDSVGLAPNVATSLSSLSSSTSHHPRQPPQFLHSPPQRPDNISSASSNGTFSVPSPGPFAVTISKPSTSNVTIAHCKSDARTGCRRNGKVHETEPKWKRRNVLHR